MMYRQGVIANSTAIRSVRSHAFKTIGLAGAAILWLGAGTSAVASTPSPPPSDQLLVTSANSDGGAVLDLNVTPSSPNPPFTPKILSTTTQLNSDAKSHGSFD